MVAMEEFQEGLGWSFLGILNLRLEMASKLDYGMTCGVGIRPSWKLF
jgi:hypothetical protein